MAWPDKVGLGVACLIVAFAFYVSFLVIKNIPDTVTAEDFTHWGIWIIKAQLLVALPVWLVARLIDFGTGGPARRKAQRKAQREAQREAQQNSN